jgi:hypothetical protein
MENQDIRNEQLMNTAKLLLTHSYISQLVTLSWNDIYLAIKDSYLPPDAAIEHAQLLLCETCDTPQTVLELASLREGESIHPLIDRIVMCEDETITGLVYTDKFLYAVLSWVYDYRAEYSEPLEVVECIYADFDYPDEVAKFVRYMPSIDPPLATVELNTERLNRHWAEYLERKREWFQNQ